MISEAQKQDLRDRNPVTTVAAQWVALRRGQRGGLVGPCPIHSPNPMAKDSTSFECWDDHWVCASCSDGGDVFRLVMLRDGCNFAEAVAVLGGEQEVDPEKAARRAAEIAEKQRQQEEQERRRRERDMTRCERLFDRAKRIESTRAEAYLAGRGLKPNIEWTFDLRYDRALAYHGYPDAEAGRTEELGVFPAMLAAIRDHEGRMIGLHRTYLDPETTGKLKPPGDAGRNKAKKILGDQVGGLIRLSAPKTHVAIGEGIETSRAWRLLRQRSADWGVAAAVSLGNLSGRAAEMRDHPSDRLPSGRARRIPSEPDFDEPGIILPEGVQSVALLGDGDSEPVLTRARLLMGGKRFERQGAKVLFDMAPTGADWNDVLIARRSAS